jgi:hypothetical protein
MQPFPHRTSTFQRIRRSSSMHLWFNSTPRARAGDTPGTAPRPSAAELRPMPPSPGATSPARRRRRHVAVAPAPEACGLGPQGACHRIECRDYSDGRRFCDTKAACVYMVRITPTSLRRARTSDSRRIRLYGSAPWRDGESLPSGLLVRQTFVGGAAHFGNVSEAFTSLTTSALPPTAPR